MLGKPKRATQVVLYREKYPVNSDDAGEALIYKPRGLGSAYVYTVYRGIRLQVFVLDNLRQYLIG